MMNKVLSQSIFAEKQLRDQILLRNEETWEQEEDNDNWKNIWLKIWKMLANSANCSQFHQQLLRTQIPNVQKDSQVKQLFVLLLGSSIKILYA